jgi:hypothetical protein
MTADEGGFQRPHSSGIKPHMKIGDVFTSCIVWGQKDEFFVPGQQYEVGLELPFWDTYKDGVYAGMPLQLNQGSRIVATGIVKEILGKTGDSKP